MSHRIIRNVAGFDKSHHMLASVNLDSGAVANRIVLHYWAPRLPTVVIPTELNMGHLQLLRGLENLGSLWVPPTTAPSPEMLSDYIFGLSESDEMPDAGSAVEYEDRILKNIGAALQRQPDTSDGVPFSLYRLPVLSRNEEGLLRSTSTLQLWNWVKRESPYRREGAWTEDLLNLLTGAEHSAGGNLQLLLRGANPANLKATLQELEVNENTPRHIVTTTQVDSKTVTTVTSE